jgi:hypothetical protein
VLDFIYINQSHGLGYFCLCIVYHICKNVLLLALKEHFLLNICFWLRNWDHLMLSTTQYKLALWFSLGGAFQVYFLMQVVLNLDSLSPYLCPQPPPSLWVILYSNLSLTIWSCQKGHLTFWFGNQQ